jgi:hypothetical protein
VVAVGDHRHHRLAGVGGQQLQRLPELPAVRRPEQHLRQRLAGGQEVDRGAARGPPEFRLVVRVDRVVVLDDERVVQVVRGRAVPDQRAVHPGGVGPVRGRQRAGVGRPEQEPVTQRGVVPAPGQPGRDGLGVDAHLLQLGVAGPAALGAVRGPAAAHRVVGEGQPVRVRRLTGRDGLHGGAGGFVQVVPQQPGGEHEVQLEGGVPEQLPAPLVAAGQPVGAGVPLDGGERALLQPDPFHPGQAGVVVLDGEQHRVAQHGDEPEVGRPVGVDRLVPLLLDPAGVQVQQPVVGVGDRVVRRVRPRQPAGAGQPHRRHRDRERPAERQEVASGQRHHGTSTGGTRMCRQSVSRRPTPRQMVRPTP